MTSKRHTKGNNPLSPGYDPEKPPYHILYLDANNLYGWAMCKPLPIRNFKWSDKILGEDVIMSIGPNVKKGYILEIDLEYPAEWHEEHNDYTFAPEKKKGAKRVVFTLSAKAAGRAGPQLRNGQTDADVRCWTKKNTWCITATFSYIFLWE